ncbi:MAG: tetratricopeptide repeat-containing sulfotransferase family protein [Woeseiaceae bacterium]|nr:sulfotransferase [Woeseiaceae bacterium]
MSRASLALRLFEEAQGYLDEATRLSPKSVMARETYGDLMFVQGRLDEAIREYNFAKEINNQRSQIDKKIEHTRLLQKELSQKLSETSKSISSLNTGGLDIAKEMIEAKEHQEAGRTDSAEDIYRNILKEDPMHIEAARLLAGIAMEHEKYRDAEIFLQRVVKNAPDYSRAWVDLVTAQREQKKFNEALDSAQKLLMLDPSLSESYMVLASVEGASGLHEEAIITYKKAINIDPNRAGAMCSMGHHLKTLGRHEEAVDAYRQAILVKSNHTESYWSLANLKTFSFLDEEVLAMKTLLATSDLSDLGRVHLFNALGLEYEFRKDYDKAFDNMSSCNVLRRKSESYDPVEFETTIDAHIEFMPAKVMQASTIKEKTVTPIFVVGLPRSGSTLIEQIIASHSLAEGTHELHEFTIAMQLTRDKFIIKERVPEAFSFFNDEHWEILGDYYLSNTEKYRTDKLFFIDKNPNNFMFIGAIKLAIPNAKIINARRHPLDSCYGSFKQLFASGQPFSYDLVELGEYYMEYQRIMEHWHAVCPGFVLDVNYEEVVSDLDNQVKRILDFCDLPFEEGCVRFHETERAIKTASSEQVRKPIYSNSVNLWRNYEDNLKDLIEILEPILLSLPPKDRPNSL